MKVYPWLEAVDKEFSERFADDRLPHALLLHGPRDTGKTQLASQFVATVPDKTLLVAVIDNRLAAGKKH